MHFKLIIALVDEENTDAVMETAREAGATGATIISNARGEGLEKNTTFLGLTLNSQRDMLMFLVEEHLSRHILEKIGEVGNFEDASGAGIAFQIDVEDAIGVMHQVEELTEKIEEEI